LAIDALPQHADGGVQDIAEVYRSSHDVVVLIRARIRRMQRLPCVVTATVLVLQYLLLLLLLPITRSTAAAQGQIRPSGPFEVTFTG
jgi:hypothetical protein